MTWTLPENSTDLADFGVKLSENAPFLVPSILFMLWALISFGGYFTQERKIGAGNIAMWLTIGGLVTTTISFILFLIVGLINNEMVIIIMALTFGFGIWAFIASRNDIA